MTKQNPTPTKQPFGIGMLVKLGFILLLSFVILGYCLFLLFTIYKTLNKKSHEPIIIRQPKETQEQESSGDSTREQTKKEAGEDSTGQEDRNAS